MSTWRLALSLATLRTEINDVWPGRSKVSDGTKGDDAHAARVSDHNPNARGVVTALDITNDPDDGPVATELAEYFRALGRNGDERVKYVISARRIASERENWAWRPYTGVNAHLHHVHISVSTSPRFYDSCAPWGLEDSMAKLDKDDYRAIAAEVVRQLAADNAPVTRVERIQGAMLKDVRDAVAPLGDDKAKGRLARIEQGVEAFRATTPGTVK